MLDGYTQYALTAPTGVQASDGLFSEQVRISWNGVGDATFYKVARNTTNSTVGATVLSSNALASPFDDLTASHNTEYYYWVQACKNSGCSDYSVVDTGYLSDDYYIFLPLLNKNFATSVDPIKNGGFENGQDGSWTEYSSNGFDLILPSNLLLVPPHQGNYAVWLGGEDGEISRLSQTIAVSSGSHYLHFWYWVGSEDFCDYDHFSVKINELEKFQTTLCSDNSTFSWVERVLNLESYSGTTVKLLFEVITDSSLNSNVFLDDVGMSFSSTVTNVESENGDYGNVSRRKK